MCAVCARLYPLNFVQSCFPRMPNKQFLAVMSALTHAGWVCACVALRVGVIIKRYTLSIISRLNNRVMQAGY